MSAKIKNFERYGSEGFQWDVVITDDAGEFTKTYRTNKMGEGLWWVGEYEAKQVSGTCQYSLSSNPEAARSKVRRDAQKVW